MIGAATIPAGLVTLVTAAPARGDSGAPAVSQLSAAWDPAPAVLVGAGLALLLFVQAFTRMRRRGRTDHAGWLRLLLFVLAVAAGTLPLVSPLDAIGDDYLLSAHMLQHVLIGDAAPALVLVALRGPLFFFLLPRFALRPLSQLQPLRRLVACLLRPAVGFAVWIVVIAAWHVPAVYDYALSHQTAHDLEHLSFIVAGLLVWMQIVDPARRGRLTLAQRFGYMLGLLAAGSVLAGLLILSSTPLYQAYARAGPRLLGISPLLDQQLAGIAMVAEQLAMLGLCACFLARSHLRAPRRHQGRPGHAATLTTASLLPPGTNPSRERSGATQSASSP